MHRRQSDAVMASDGDVIVADNRDLVGNHAAAPFEPVNGRECQDVVVGDICGDAVLSCDDSEAAPPQGRAKRRPPPLTSVLTIVWRHERHVAMAEAVKKGETISQVLERNGKLFPPLVMQMTAVGERAGTVDEMLEEIAGFYEQQVDQIMGSLSSIIEPILILLLGGAVGGIALAIITPIYSLTTKFGQ